MTALAARCGLGVARGAGYGVAMVLGTLAVAWTLVSGALALVIMFVGVGALLPVIAVMSLVKGWRR